MSKYELSKNSWEKLATCHDDLQDLLKEAVEMSMIDFGVSEGYRSIERQQMLFQAGKSKIDGISRRSKHNEFPSLAVDIYAYVNGRVSYAEKDLCYLGGLITGVWQSLFVGEVGALSLRWGGNWDGDGEIITDQGFIDLPHFEL